MLALLASLLVATFSTPSPALAQSPDGASGNDAAGRILGKVVDQSTGEAVPNAQVTVVNGPSTLTDLNGRFIFSTVPAGETEVTVQALGYATKTVTEVVVLENDVVTLDIALETQAIQVEGVRVSAARERGSAAYLLDERRTSDAMVEAVGSQEISRRPDSDAADVAQRMTGVTVAEGKYVFVRGLGERYSQTTLNGSSLPSPEPEREVVPLDLFPSGFLESLQTQKSYTPDLPADFSGGSVKIETKDFPSRFGGRISVSTSANTKSQFRDDFLRYGGGGLDWLGVDDGTREAPQAIEDLMGGVMTGQRLPSDPTQRVEIGEALRDMDQTFAPLVRGTPLNRGIDVSIGGRTGLGDESEIGYFLAGTYSDDYTIRDGEIERKWRASAFRPETVELSEPNVDYLFTRGTRNISWGTIGNVAWKPTPNHQIALKTTVNLSTDDEARTYLGENREDIGGTVFSERARFVERLMTWGQLSGEHLAFLDSRIDWRVTGARAARDEPMLRETIYLEDDGDFRLLDFTESGRYFTSELIDDDLSAELDWRIPFPFLDRTAAVKLGGAWRQREREFGARRLNWTFLGNTIDDLDTALAAGEIVASSPGADELAIDEVVEPGDIYNVTDDRIAGYAMLEVPVTERLQAIVGARVETYDLGLKSRGDPLQDIQQTDVAPAVNLVYSLSPDLKVRGAYSRTLDRPEFRELAPFQFTEATSLRQLVGNPDLVPAEITSADLRVDWFWGPTELVSLGGFYKDMTDPVEQVFIAAASSAYSFQNAESATVFGIEADLQLGLGRIAAPLRPLGIQANSSWIHYEVSVRSGGIYQPTNLDRPLEGQAPYVLNLGLTYTG
ncbi:MAG: TonB-dependent receptor, partial [Gemmatimonadota bacterium]